MVELYQKNSFVPSELAKDVIAYLTDSTGKIVKLGSNRERDWTKWDEEYPSMIYDYKLFLIDKFNLEEFANPDIKRHMRISCIHDGGQVPLHDHKRNGIDWKANAHDIRINTVVQKPYEGGDPVVRNRVFSLPDELSLWMFDSNMEHGSTKVIGERPRVVVSFGFRMTEKEYEDFVPTFDGKKVPVNRYLTDADCLKVF